MKYIFRFCEPPTAGQRLRALRDFAGLTQQELADICGVNWSTILRFEKESEKNSIVFKNFIAIWTGLAKYIPVEPEIIATVIVGGKPMHEIAQKNLILF